MRKKNCEPRERLVKICRVKKPVGDGGERALDDMLEPGVLSKRF